MEHDYIAGLEPSIHSAARTYGMLYRTLRGCLQVAKPHADAHSQEQILSVEEEQAIVWLCVCKIFPIYHGAVWPVQVYNRLFKLARTQLRSKLTSNFTKGVHLMKRD